ncbi:uncharacterized protein LOC109841720, partial [Asparagus officinalis]|uniref:uncharacterized protein LOC109841720 n=1 Tax=Asparagus officinalis TaxID=4686 RepID=UPI00098E64C2
PPPDSVPETEQAAAGDAVYITVKDDGKGSGADVAEAKEEDEAAAGDAVVIAVKDDGEGVGKGSRADVAGSKEEDEKVCRICHLSPDRTVPEEGSELVMIGCGCKNELGTAHRQCAETWFRLKGNRCCEICGLNAKNIAGNEDESFIEEWHDDAAQSSAGHRNSTERVSCWRGQPFCNFLMACLHRKRSKLHTEVFSQHTFSVE